MTSVLAAALALLSSNPSHSDTVRAVVEGRIMDPLGKPIAETEVIWQDDRRSVLSRADGSYNLIVPVRAVTVVLVRRVGYDAQVLRVDLTKGYWRGEIVLQPGSFKLPDVVVTSKYAKPAEYAGTTKFDDFFRRRKMGIGTFVSREDIEKMNAIHTIEILRGIPGIYVNPGNPADPASADFKIARCMSGGMIQPVQVYIDGIRQIPPVRGDENLKLADMLSRISASGIEMIEVFRGTSQIPAEYHYDGCAVVAIWTRYNPVSVRAAADTAH